MNTPYLIESVSSLEDISRFLDDSIYAHNSKHTQQDDGDYFAKIIRGENGAVIAGIYGWTWAGACEVLTLWVNAAYRKQGLGQKLLKAAEHEAVQKKCSVILIRSYSFQAPVFYQKHGYKTEHVLDNFPPGYNYYILVKRMNSTQTSHM